jgi:hypothetical protein
MEVTSMSGSKEDKDQNETPVWAGVPESIAHRASMKWMSLEALRVLVDRLSARSLPAKVILLTTQGWIQGTLCDIEQHYDKAIDANRAEDIDIASASVHIRSEMLEVYAKQDPNLHPIDNGAIVRLMNVTMKSGGRRLRLPNMALFASDVIGFSLCSREDI